MNINEIPEALCLKLRLEIISSLIQSARTFNELLIITQASRGNLSIQLSKLEDWKFISSNKIIENKRTKTTYKITPLGMEKFEAYVSLLQNILLNSQN